MPVREIVRIATLADPVTWLIEDRSFDDVEIVGPAVLGSVGPVHVVECTFHETPEMVFWEAPAHQIVGVIGLRRCTFRNCYFRGVALIGDAEFVRRARADLRT